MAEVPHCPVHVSVPLVFVPVVRGAGRKPRKRISVNERLLDVEAILAREGIYRCPFAHCARVKILEDGK